LYTGDVRGLTTRQELRERGPLVPSVLYTTRSYPPIIKLRHLGIQESVKADHIRHKRSPAISPSSHALGICVCIASAVTWETPSYRLMAGRQSPRPPPTIKVSRTGGEPA